jgi:hypothetical protein
MTCTVPPVQFRFQVTFKVFFLFMQVGEMQGSTRIRMKPQRRLTGAHPLYHWPLYYQATGVRGGHVPVCDLLSHAPSKKISTRRPAIFAKTSRGTTGAGATAYAYEKGAE